MEPPSKEPNPTVSQPLPQQPTTPQSEAAKPTSGRKPRQRKQAESKFKRTAATAALSEQPQPTIAPRPPQAPLQPYPGPTYHIMNPSYPMSSSPFTQQPQHHPGYAPHPSSAPVNGASGPGIPGPPQYGYPMHPSAFPPHGYAPYPQYPQQMMMYAPPRPGTSPEVPQSVQSPSTAPVQSSSKRKRKSHVGKGVDKGSDDDTGVSSSDVTRAQAAQQANAAAAAIVDMKKRTKTQRACDSCRSRKIRCDILSDAEQPTCQHCKQYGFECTFFLPITETRFKKKKLEEEAAKNADSKDKSFDNGRGAVSPRTDSKGDSWVSVVGPTSTTHLLHSQATISSRIYENYDLRYHHTWEVSTSGDGLIQVQKPTGEEQQASPPKPLDLRLERDVIEKLLNSYFTDVAPILPIITQTEFLANASPPPILLYSMCLVSAARREVPQGIFDSIRYAVNTVMKADDVLSTTSIANVQSLLILCMTGDCHSQFVPNALSALWIRLGTAIRMAQDLGLHRAESVSQNIELRRRLWGACVISDRWTSLTYGHPYMIDVQDCDARLPSSGDPNDRYMDELVRLSVILGRVLKTIYSPSGLTFTTDEILYKLLEDIEKWKQNLPEELQFKGPDTSRSAGLLHLFYACVLMIFWRVFMRISYTCPAHLQFALTVEHWSGLVKLTGDSIDWLDAHEKMYDVWLLVAYATTSCALVQYHTWARRQDPEAAAKLRTLRDCVRRWEGSLSPDHMSARRKTAEIITLLYEATQGPPIPLETPALNPTGGVKGKQPLGGLAYKKDPTRPGGGVFVAHGEAKGAFKDLPAGAIINSSSDEESEGKAPVTAVPSSSLRAVPNDRAFLLSSSAFAPPLPADESSFAFARGMMTSPAVGEQLRAGSRSRADNAALASTSPTSSSMVNLTPLSGRIRGNFPNVNPAMNNVNATAPGHVQVMNVLDVPQASGTLEQFAMADTGLLEGIPGGMFDWGQWDTFFSRFNGGPSEGGASGGMAGFQQQQSRQTGSSTQQRPA